MKSIINMLLFLAAVIFILVATGIISEDDILDLLGDVELGETEQIYDEGEFKKRFDIIVGEVEVNDTSITPVKRNITWDIANICKDASIKHITNVMVKYQVKTDSTNFYLDVKKKEFYISPNLGVTYERTNPTSEMLIEESNCVRKKDITPDDIDVTKRRADAALERAIQNSDKIKNAIAEFESIKNKLIADFEEAGFLEVMPPSENTEEEKNNIPNLEKDQPIAH